jgi:uncharacterized protein YjbJ (UPF0337 family)
MKERRHHNSWENLMGRTDDVKGRAKEAAGDVTDDRDLKREGKMDRATGSVKDAVNKTREKAGDAADKVTGDDR